MTYNLEAINTLFAQIAECMHRNPARAMRLLGQAKAKVRESLERAAIPRGALAAHKPDGGDVERIRNAGAILDCLTSRLGSDHPLRLEAAEGAKRAVADLYRIAEQIDAAISAEQHQGEGEQ